MVSTIRFRSVKAIDMGWRAVLLALVLRRRSCSPLDRLAPAARARHHVLHLRRVRVSDVGLGETRARGMGGEAARIEEPHGSIPGVAAPRSSPFTTEEGRKEGFSLVRLRHKAVLTLYRRSRRAMSLDASNPLSAMGRSQTTVKGRTCQCSICVSAAHHGRSLSRLDSSEGHRLVDRVMPADSLSSS